jgi:hypothetical protein
MILSVILNVIFLSVILFFVSILIRNKRKQKIREENKRNNLINKINYFLGELKSAKTLQEIYVLHIQIWASGIRNEYIGPNKYGMFRTDDILLMKPSEVYLGNIWGLFTKPLPFWELQLDNERNIVFQQYRDTLVSNLLSIRKSLY